MSTESSVKSARRVIEILELYERLRAPLTATEIARHLRYPSSSASSLAKGLAELGYLTFDDQAKSYFPTPRILMIGRSIEEALFGSGQLSGLMADLRTETGETIVLSAKRGLTMFFVDTLMGDQPLALNVRFADALPIERSTVGIAYLSALRDDQIESILDRLGASVRRRAAKPDIRSLRRAAVTARSLGYAAGYGVAYPEIGTIAKPIVSPGAGSIYVISVGGPLDRVRSRERQIIASLRRQVARHLTSSVARSWR